MSFQTPKDLKDYKKMVNEWSEVRKQLNDKVIANKIGDQTLLETQTKIQAPTIQEIGKIHKSITKTVVNPRTGVKEEIPLTTLIDNINNNLSVTDPTSASAQTLQQLENMKTLLAKNNKISKDIRKQLERDLANINSMVVLQTVPKEEFMNIVTNTLNPVPPDDPYVIFSDSAMRRFIGKLNRGLYQSGYDENTIAAINNKLIPIVRTYENQLMDMPGIQEHFLETVSKKLFVKNVDTTLTKELEKVSDVLEEIQSGVDTSIRTTQQIGDQTLAVLDENKEVDKEVALTSLNEIQQINQSIQNITNPVDKLITAKNQSDQSRKPGSKSGKLEQFQERLNKRVANIAEKIDSPVSQQIVQKIEDKKNITNEDLEELQRIEQEKIDRERDIELHKKLDELMNKKWDELKTNTRFNTMDRIFNKYKDKSNVNTDVNFDNKEFIKISKDEYAIGLQIGDKNAYVLPEIYTNDSKIVIVDNDGKLIYEKPVNKNINGGLQYLLFESWPIVLSQVTQLNYKYTQEDIDELRIIFNKIGITDKSSSKVKLLRGDTTLLNKIGIYPKEQVEKPIAVLREDSDEESDEESGEESDEDKPAVKRTKPPQAPQKAPVPAPSKAPAPSKQTPYKPPPTRGDPSSRGGPSSRGRRGNKGYGIANQSSIDFLLNQPKRHAYKLTPTGKFGDLNIDMPQLISHHRIKAVNGTGVTLLDKKAPVDLIELLTKRFNPKKNYTDKSVKLFKELVKHSGLPVHMGSGKYKLLHSKGSPLIKVVSNPDDLVERLAVLSGEIDSGNHSDAIRNEMMSIIDILLNNNILTKEQHKAIYDQYLS